ncbi:MAG TPA: chemotaxis protein CheW [Desulfosalsimonadaceae bacterium]|nr:chemotaxis protein CheW [Desulfosalsimonadaceae bacterium]
MSQQVEEKQADLSELAGKYLTFNLGNEGYGLEILKVQEIIGMQEITKIPRTPAYVKGVINLRGKVIPIIDLRSKFGMPEQELTRKTCIIVVQVQRGESALIMGIVVDEVSEVLNISGDQIEAAPSLGTNVDTHFILGMAKTESAVKILLDIDKVLSAEEIDALSRTG